MRSKNGRGWEPDDSSEEPILRQLEGYADMGMRREMCRIVRQILARKRISSTAFDQIVRAIGVLSDPKRWMAELESAWQRQSASVRRDANSAMLALYASESEWEKAARHVALRTLCSPSDLLFSMQTMLETGRMKEAAKVARKARKALKNAEDAFDCSCLIEAQAIYHARVGEWSEAFDLWNRAPRNQPLSGNAAAGCVEVWLVQALAMIREELATLHGLPVDFEYEISLPGNTDGMRKETEMELRKFQRALEKMIPAERRLELGFDAASPSD